MPTRNRKSAGGKDRRRGRLERDGEKALETDRRRERRRAGRRRRPYRRWPSAGSPGSRSGTGRRACPRCRRGRRTPRRCCPSRSPGTARRYCRRRCCCWCRGPRSSARSTRSGIAAPSSRRARAPATGSRAAGPRRRRGCRATGPASRGPDRARGVQTAARRPRPHPRRRTAAAPGQLTSWGSAKEAPGRRQPLGLCGCGGGDPQRARGARGSGEARRPPGRARRLRSPPVPGRPAGAVPRRRPRCGSWARSARAHARAHADLGRWRQARRAGPRAALGARRAAPCRRSWRAYVRTGASSEGGGRPPAATAVSRTGGRSLFPSRTQLRLRVLARLGQECRREVTLSPASRVGERAWSGRAPPPRACLGGCALGTLGTRYPRDSRPGGVCWRCSAD